MRNWSRKGMVSGSMHVVGDEPFSDGGRAVALRDLSSVAQESAHPREVSTEPEVVAHQDQRVERPEAARQALDAGLVDLLKAPHAGQRDLGRRRVDPDDPVAFPLEVDGVTTRAASHIEHATPDLSHRLALDL